MDGPFLARELGDHRVHQELHVVGDDLDDRVAAGPAVLLHRRGEDAHVGRTHRTAQGKLPVGQGRSQEVLGTARKEVLGGHVPVVEAQEGLKCLTAGPECQLRRGVDDLGTRLLKQRRHG